MDKRLSFAFKICGFKSSSISFFSSFLLMSLFFILCTHGYIYLNLAYVHSKITHIETWIISISPLDDFNTFVVIFWLFFRNQLFQSIFQEHYQNVKRSVSRSGLTFCRYIRFARVCSNVDDFNNRNLFLTAKLSKQGYRYHKKHFLNSTTDTQSKLLNTTLG